MPVDSMCHNVLKTNISKANLTGANIVGQQVCSEFLQPLKLERLFNRLVDCVCPHQLIRMERNKVTITFTVQSMLHFYCPPYHEL